MWTKCLPRDTIQPMEYALRNSNEIICKHRKLPLQVPGKVFGESGQSVSPLAGCGPVGEGMDGMAMMFISYQIYIRFKLRAP